jgi:hypothetical protein
MCWRDMLVPILVVLVYRVLFSLRPEAGMLACCNRIIKFSPCLHERGRLVLGTCMSRKKPRLSTGSV